MRATSGTSAGTATSSSSVKGQRISWAGRRASRSEPSSDAVGRNGMPIEAAISRSPKLRWLHSS